MLNTSDWKEFKLSDLFDCLLSKGDLKESECDPGSINLISSGTTNNGVVKRIDEAGDGKAEIFSANCLTLDMFCNCFYQDEKFYSVSHGRVNILVPKFEMNQQIGLFIATIINKEQYRFSYGRAVYNSFAENIIIKLPVDIEGKPNWKFMKNYILEIESRERESNSNLKNSLITKNIKPITLDVNKWVEFPLNELFEISGSKTTLVEELEEFGFGKYPYVTTKATNNGVDGFFDFYTEQGNCLVIDSAVLGHCTYQELPFTASDHVEVLRPKFEMNQYIAMFLVTLINQDTYRYSYGRKRSQKQIRCDVIKLPVNLEGKPNWEFMEEYIKSLPYSDRI